eukprot:PhM_4_TR3669/c0_g1_i1/m.76381/K18777/MTR3, MT57; cap3/cap4 methyltransferase
MSRDDDAPIEVLHSPSSLGIPLSVNDAMPAVPYSRRRGEAKTAIHWGQRKLLISEIELLSLYCKPGVSYWFVYAGAAPCSHMLCLERMYAREKHMYELVDPSPFDNRLKPSAHLTLRNEFFTNFVAYEIASRRMSRCPALKFIFQHHTLDVLEKPPDLIPDKDKQREAHNTGCLPSIYEDPLVLPAGISALCYALAEDVPVVFLSDIRSGSLASDNFEQHVVDNMKAQAAWHRIIRPEYSLLKFRLPYMIYDVPSTGEVRHHHETHTPYMDGEVLLPIWTRPTSTECRLLCRGYAPDKMYDNKRFEDQLHYFNATIRTRVHYNHRLDDPDLDHRYDSTAEVLILAAHEAMSRLDHSVIPEDVRGGDRIRLALDTAAAMGLLDSVYEEVGRNVKVISRELQRSFTQAIQARDEIVLQKARAGGFEDKVRALMRQAQVERDRPIWWRNVPESDMMLKNATEWNFFKMKA